MRLFFERFPRVSINELPSYVRIFWGFRWGVIYLPIPYSELEPSPAAAATAAGLLSFIPSHAEKGVKFDVPSDALRNY